jgi:hypothetical protein
MTSLEEGLSKRRLGIPKLEERRIPTPSVFASPKLGFDVTKSVFNRAKSQFPT